LHLQLIGIIHPAVNNMISYDVIAASSAFREAELLRAKTRYDEAQSLHHAG